MPTPAPPPVALPIRQALDASEPMSRLAQRLRASRERLAAIQGALPPTLRPHVQPGPIDDTGWTVLAANAAVSAKLRQLLPSLQARLQADGWPDLPIRVRVLSPIS